MYILVFFYLLQSIYIITYIHINKIKKSERWLIGYKVNTEFNSSEIYRYCFTLCSYIVEVSVLPPWCSYVHWYMHIFPNVRFLYFYCYCYRCCLTLCLICHSHKKKLLFNYTEYNRTVVEEILDRIVVFLLNYWLSWILDNNRRITKTFYNLNFQTSDWILISIFNILTQKWVCKIRFEQQFYYNTL